MEELREVHHVEIRKTEPRQTLNISVETGPTAVLSLLRDVLQRREQEVFVILILDGRLIVESYSEVSVGMADAVMVPTRETFRTALACGARALILAHNHPSGDPTPSEEDKAITARLRFVGAAIDIPIFDHIIIGSGERYYSFAHDGGAGDALVMNAPKAGPELD